MALARALNLDVASTHIQSVLDESQPRNYLLVARYDRQSGIPVQRLHQEYCCQALGVVSEHKYQNEGGPGLAQAFALLRNATRPSALRTLKLLD